jgi:hypothetical protein
MAMPKGRLTVRKGASALTASGPTIRLWDSEAPAGSTLAKLETRAYLAALDAIDKLEAHRAEAKASNKFTESGLVEILHRGRQAVAAAKQEAAERRAKLTLLPPNPTDVVGAMRRQEIRTWLRSLPPKERNDYVARNMDRLDPEVALAIREAPSELSGVLNADQKVILDRALEAQHGDAIRDVLELERAVEIAEHAVEAVRGEIARDVGVLDPHTSINWQRRTRRRRLRRT